MSRGSQNAIYEYTPLRLIGVGIPAVPKHNLALENKAEPPLIYKVS
jgi:hypothetical protein